VNYALAILLYIALAVVPAQQVAQPRYVAPYGSGQACASDEPCSLSYALQSAGDVWLLPGTYTGDIVANTPGVTVRSIPGARARIDGSLTVNASDTTWQDLEITHTGWISRISAYPGSNPPDVSQKWLNIYAPRTKVLDSIIHDLAGIGIWKPAVDSEFARNLVYNNGWQGTDRGHGPGIYSQNNPDGAKWITDNVMGPTYSMVGFEFYGSSIAPLQHYRIERNTMIGTRFLLGGGQPVVDAHVLGNILWKSSIEVGYTNPLNGDAEIRDNYVALGRITPRGLQSLVMTGNTAVNSGGVDLMDLRAPTVPYSYTVNANTYLSNRTKVFWLGPTLLDFPGWQAQGYDAGGTFGPLPTTNRTFVQAWGGGRGVVSIVNWTQAPTVTVDLTQLGLAPGASYRLINAQNPAEGQEFVAGTPVSIPTAQWTVALPYAASAPLRAFDPRFLVFLVEPV
jgi:hypothetical protein